MQTVRTARPMARNRALDAPHGRCSSSLDVSSLPVSILLLAFPRGSGLLAQAQGYLAQHEATSHAHLDLGFIVGLSESALPAMPPKWHPRISADYLATRPKRFPVVLRCHRSGPGGFRAIAPTKASIPESGIGISNPIRLDNHKETPPRPTRPTSGLCKMRW